MPAVGMKGNRTVFIGSVEFDARTFNALYDTFFRMTEGIIRTDFNDGIFRMSCL